MVLRRALLAAAVAAPVGAALALARRASGPVVGAQPFSDSRVEGGAFPRRLVDATGRPRLLARPPRRIVSTYLAAEEILAALVPVERVAGVSIFVDDPATSNAVGVYPPGVARLRAEPERVLALDPDLVCVAGFTDPEAMRLLAGAGVTLLRWSRLDSFADVLDEIRLLGAAAGADAAAAALASSVEAQLAEVARRLAGVRPLRVLYYDTPGYTMGAGTLIDEMLARAGGRNVAAEVGIRGPGQIGVETLLALEPEAIVMPVYEAAGSPGELPLWRRVPPVVADRVHEVPAAWITAVSQHAARGLARVARLLHPQRFS